LPSAPPSLSISVGVQVNRGIVRSKNDDRVGSARTPFGDAFVLSDGKAGGATAAAATVDGYVRNLQQQGHPTVESALQLAHSEFTTRLASTAVVAIINGTRATIGRWGDSRAYLLRGNRLGLLAEDSAPPNLGKLSIMEVQLQPGDGLLLCSDGLWRQVPHADLEAVALSPLSANSAAEAFVHLGLHAGAMDNVSLQWMRFVLPVTPPPQVRRWFGMRPRDAAVLMSVVALIALAAALMIWNANRPMERPARSQTGPVSGVHCFGSTLRASANPARSRDAEFEKV